MEEDIELGTEYPRTQCCGTGTMRQISIRSFGLGIGVAEFQELTPSANWRLGLFCFSLLWLRILCKRYRLWREQKLYAVQAVCLVVSSARFLCYIIH